MIDNNEMLLKFVLVNWVVEGFFDDFEVNFVCLYIDFGGIKIFLCEGLNLCLEVEEQFKCIVVVGFDYVDFLLQVQFFVVLCMGGFWDEICVQLCDQVKVQGGCVEECEGFFGKEFFVEVFVIVVEGLGLWFVCFIGIDGLCWFLCGVIGGVGVFDFEVVVKVEDLFCLIVVVCGGVLMLLCDFIFFKMLVMLGFV